MSYQERDAKKRKTAHNGSSTSLAPASSGRDWTLSIAVPTSILSNLASPEQVMNQAGRIARALAVFSVDEIVIFDDTPPSARPRVPADPDAYTGDTDPAHYLHHVLSYLEAPPFMRKALFPLHPNLRFANKLPGLDMPHHPHPKEWLPYGEGVTRADKTSTGKGTLVDCGLEKPVEIKEKIPPKTRITLRFPDDESQSPEPVHPDTPRKEAGYSWGYQVRKCSSLSNVFTESPYEGGYDISIGTSERGTTIPQTFPPNKRYNFKHIMIVFGGPRGLEYAAMNDEELVAMEIQGPKTKELFDHWVNVLPNQGSRNIQTEEAVFIALTSLRGVWER